METNHIEKRIEIAAPVSRVWRALTDHLEFSQWFGVTMENPFVVGRPSAGQITYPGFEHLRMDILVTQLEPEQRFAYTWHPYAIDPKADYSKEEPTLVEFRLKPTGKGTLLTVVETGFDRLPPGRRPDALEKNDEGWTEQLENIRTHVGHT